MAGDPLLAIELGAAALAGLALTLATLLRGWRQWLELKREHPPIRQNAGGPPRGRGEIAELRARVRKLEAIANGIEL